MTVLCRTPWPVTFSSWRGADAAAAAEVAITLDFIQISRIRSWSFNSRGRSFLH
jgi:hypothetical protein